MPTNFEWSRWTNAPISIQATNFGLKNDMIQQVQNSCQFHGLPGDDANKHLDNFLHVTQSIKVTMLTSILTNSYMLPKVSKCLFPHSSTHHATAWFDHFPRNSINTLEQMAKMFLGKYFPPSMVTKLRNEITNFRQHPDESLFEAWERGTFIKRRPKECYDLIENMTTHHNEWDTSAQQISDLRTMEELCQPSLNRGGPIAPIAIHATNFGLKNDMIQQVYNSCQFHGLPCDDANKHLDKFLHVTQSIKVNVVTDDAFHLYLFSHSLTHHATSWFDRLPWNSINTFEQMAKMFLGERKPRNGQKSDQNRTKTRSRWGKFDKIKEKGDECIFVGTMALEHGSLSPGRKCQENASHGDKTGTTSNELDLLFSPMFDELLNGSSKVVSKSSAVSAADAPYQRQQPTTSLNNHTTPAPTCQNPSIASSVTSNENINQAESHADNDQVTDDEFINIFSTPVQDQGETSSRHVDSSNMHTFYQRYPSEQRWTKDHPLEQVIGNPSQSVRTRRQLESDAEMCMFALTVSWTEPKNIKEAMADSTWIESMQEELYQFDRLDVWELVDNSLDNS
nr:hypothetical protein [Tanacetum cinerariifolium]